MDPTLDIGIRVGCAALAGVVLGLNRWLHHKSAGVKTHALVAIGASIAVLCMVSPGQTGAGEALDASSRVFQGLLAGVGFLGAGVIIHNAGGRRIQGLTTAASIWATTILGAAFGMGLFRVATLGLLAAGVVLVTGSALERGLGRLLRDHARSDEGRSVDKPED